MTCVWSVIRMQPQCAWSVCLLPEIAMGQAISQLNDDIEQCVDNDVMSSEEEHKHQHQRRKKPLFRQKPKAPLPLIFAADGKTVAIKPREPSSSDQTMLPRNIKSLSEFPSNASWLNVSDPSSQAKCKGPADEVKQKKRDLDMAKFKEDPQAAPELDPFFKDLLAKLRQPEINAQVHGRRMEMKEVLKLLAEGAAHLPYVSCHTETELLKEAGKVTMRKLQGAIRDFPPCVNGEAGCWLFALYKRVGRSWMTDDELDLFMRENRAPPQRICIACHRYIITSIFSTMLAEGENRVTIDSKTTLLQQYCNKKECEGGYREEFLLFSPAGKKIHGLWGPVVNWQPVFLATYTDEDGVWSLDQSRLCWQPRTTNIPEIGETDWDFQ